MVSVNHSSLISLVEKPRATRSSWTSEPGRFPLLASLLSKHGPPPVVPADLPCCPLAHGLACSVGLIGEESGPKLGVVPMRVKEGAGTVDLDQLSRGDLLFPPGTVGLARELQHSQGHRDGDPVVTQLAHKR